MTFAPHSIHRRAGLLLLALLMPLGSLRAEEPGAAQTSPREILRDALYAEEVTRDAGKAAEHYAKVIELYKAQQPFAATALFRLAEVRRKQGNKEEATKLYQQLLREFPAAEVEGKLARENLAALGAAEVPAENGVVVDEEAQQLRRIQDMVKNTPDRVNGSGQSVGAVVNGQPRVLEYLLDSGLEKNPASLLPRAAESGHVKIVQMLIARVPKDTPEAQQALWTAVEKGYKQVATLLLDSGVKPNGFAIPSGDTSAAVRGQGGSTEAPGKISLLQLALRGGDLELVRLLLDHGADPNQLSEKPSPGSPLHHAAGRGTLETVKLLLSKGADPNIGAPSTGYTPLHSAAGANRPEALAALLEAGAKLEGRTTVTEPEPGKTNPGGGLTPLLVAAREGAPATLAILLKKGADPNARAADGTPALGFAVRSGSDKRDEVVRLLLDHKADPNVRFGKLWLSREAGHSDPFFTGTESETNTDYSLLYLAASTVEDVPLMARLLGAGCTAGPELSLTIAYIARKDTEGKVVKALVAQHHGAVNLEELPDMQSWTEAARAAYLEAIVYPTLASRPGSSFVAMDGKIRPVELSPPQATASASLARSILAHPGFTARPQRSDYLEKLTLTLVRKGSGAQPGWTRIPLDPDAEAPFPALLPGDIVEFAATPGPSIPGKSPQDHQQQLHESLTWSLHKKVKFPVTLEIEGSRRELTLRGDLLVYDPRRPDEVPWTGAARLVGIFKDYQKGDPEITVQRQGWKDVLVPKHPSGANADFGLDAGDKIVVRWKSYPDASSEDRRKEVRIHGIDLAGTGGTGDDGPPESWYGDVLAGTPGAGVTLPTLIQALADLDGRWTRYFASSPYDYEILPAWLKKKTPYPVALFPYPDFSGIRIRRLEADGSERLIPVNLDPLLAAAAQGTLTAEQARAADQILQGGDIVEIPTRADKRNEPWKGWSAAEIELFSKALDCRIQYTDKQGVIALREVRYRAPRYLGWGDSWLPVLPPAGTSSLTAIPALFYDSSARVEVTRAGETSESAEADKVFLRDGDAVKNVVQQAQGLPIPRPDPSSPAAPGVRPPRPRGGR